MADLKISQFPAYTSPIATDLFAIVDVTAGVTKKIAFSDLKIAIGNTGGGAVNSVNGKVGVVVLTTDDISDVSNSHKFVTASDLAHLASLSGSNTGDVTIAGQNYLSLSGQTLTANAVDLSGSNVTGTLAAARFPALTGDVTSSAGSLNTAIGTGKVSNLMLAGSITAAKLVGTDIATVGTITSGTWHGTIVDVLYGGTGSGTASGARTNLGLAIGTNVQAFNANLAAIAGLTSAADKIPYFTGSGTAGLITIGSGLSFSGGTLSASGAVTTVSDSGAGTMTVSPNSGAVLLGINLAHNFTWTGTQVYSAASTFNADAHFTSSVEFDTLPTSSTLATSSNQFVTKAYVDPLFTGQIVKPSCIAKTTVALAANTYNNGTAGVGATLTANANGAIANQDGVALSVNDSILVNYETPASHNGIYQVTQLGDASHPYILTRRADYDQSSEMVQGTYVYIVLGTVSSNQLWAMTFPTVTTVGTDAVTFTQVNSATVYTATLGVKLSGTNFSADLSASGAITLSGNSLQVAVDGSSVTISGNQLVVGAAGITNAMLAGSITDSKLSTISTAGKVSGAALTSLSSIPGGAGLIPTANLGTGGATSLKFLRGDQAWVTPASAGLGDFSTNTSSSTTGDIVSFADTTGKLGKTSGWNIVGNTLTGVASGGLTVIQPAGVGNAMSIQSAPGSGTTGSGNINISVAAAGNTNANGGSVSITAGQSTGTGVPGSVVIQALGNDGSAPIAGGASPGDITLIPGLNAYTTAIGKIIIYNPYLLSTVSLDMTPVNSSYNLAFPDTGGVDDTIAVLNAAQTFTQKTIDGNNNTLLNISATSLSFTVALNHGGLGFTTATTGDLFLATASNTPGKLSDVATGNALISGGVGVAPSYGKIGLATHVSGGLPVANGGTNILSYTVGDLIQASGSTTLAALAAVATGNVLISGGAATVSSWGKVGLTTHVSGTLAIANGGTNATAFGASRLIFMNSANTAFSSSASLTYITPKLILTAATTAGASLNLPTGTAPTSPVEGDMWNDSTQKVLKEFVGGMTQSIDGTLGTTSATSAAVTNSTETSVVGTLVGSKTIKANSAALGSHFKVRAVMTYNTAASPGNITIRIKIGSTAPTVFVLAPAASITNGMIVFESTLQVNVLGATGSIVTTSQLNIYTASTWSSFSGFNTNTVALNADQIVDVTAQWTSIVVGNSISGLQFSMQKLN